jgi:hypothetical protein
MRNHPSGFEVKPLTNCRPWFQGSIKKSALLISMCTVQIAHGATQPLDRPTTEYLTCATKRVPINQYQSGTNIIRLTTCYQLEVIRRSDVGRRLRRPVQRSTRALLC